MNPLPPRLLCSNCKANVLQLKGMYRKEHASIIRRSYFGSFRGFYADNHPLTLEWERPHIIQITDILHKGIYCSNCNIQVPWTLEDINSAIYGKNYKEQKSAIKNLSKSK